MIIKVLFLLVVLGSFIYAKYMSKKTQIEKKTKKYSNRNEKGQFIHVYKKPIVAYRYIQVNDYKKGSYLLKVKNNFI